MKNDYKEAMDKRDVDADFEINTINKLISIRQEKIRIAKRRSAYISISSLAAAACLVFAIFTFSPLSGSSGSKDIMLAPAQEPANTSESPATVDTTAPESEPNRTKTPQPLDRTPDTDNTAQNEPVSDAPVPDDEVPVDDIPTNDTIAPEEAPLIVTDEPAVPQGPREPEPVPEEDIAVEDIPLMDSGNSSPLSAYRYNYAWVFAGLALSIACVSLAIVMLVRLALLKRREKNQGKE